VQKGNCVQHGLPLGPGAHIQQVLAHTCCGQSHERTYHLLYALIFYSFYK
jgi:hypothetical protein